VFVVDSSLGTGPTHRPGRPYEGLPQDAQDVGCLHDGRFREVAGRAQLCPKGSNGGAHNLRGCRTISRHGSQDPLSSGTAGGTAKHTCLPRQASGRLRFGHRRRTPRPAPEAGANAVPGSRNAPAVVAALGAPRAAGMRASYRSVRACPPAEPPSAATNLHRKIKGKPRQGRGGALAGGETHFGVPTSTRAPRAHGTAAGTQAL